MNLLSHHMRKSYFLLVLFVLFFIFIPFSISSNVYSITTRSVLASPINLAVSCSGLTGSDYSDCTKTTYGAHTDSHTNCKGDANCNKKVDEGAAPPSAIDTSLNKLGNLMLGISSWFLAQAGGLMDKSIEYSVNIGSQKGLEKSVEVGWKVFRDVANMFFIFILLYIAIATILQLNSFDTKRTLAKLIVVALLINFSLFATRVVIDFSNVISNGFYTEITNNRTLGIAEQFTEKVGIIGIYKVSKTTDGVTNVVLEKAGDGKDAVFKVGLLGSVFLIILAFVFLAGAIMFIMRTIILLFLMVLSPLAFLGSILPATAGYARRWWHALISNAFLAPIYLLLIWITLETIKGLTKVTGEGSQQTFASWLATGNVDGIDIFFNFAIITGMAIGALVISKSLGGWTGSTVVNYTQKGARYLGGKTKRFARGAAIGAGYGIYRNTVSRGAAAVADSPAMKRFGSSPKRRWLGLNVPLAGVVSKIAKVGGERNYANLSKKYAGNRVDAYKATKEASAKRKYFDSLSNCTNHFHQESARN